MKKIDIESLLKIADSAGLKKDHFTSEVFFYAWLYRSIIVSLIKKFCSARFTITNSEYGVNRESNKIDLSILFKIEGHKKIKDVGEYISSHLQIIPPELRQKFNILVGFNYGDDGGFVIDESDLRFITQEEFMADESEGSLTDEIINQDAYAANRKLRLLLI